MNEHAITASYISPTTTSENFVGSWSRFCSSDTAAHSDYFVLMRLLHTLTHSLTHSPLCIGTPMNFIHHLGLFTGWPKLKRHHFTFLFCL